MSHDVVADPLRLERGLAPDDESRILHFLARVFPSLQPVGRRHAACMYSLTPDKHFVLDIHPECPALVLGAGFSGHGFKFAPVIGEILAELALEGTTQHPIDFLRLSRFDGV